MKLIYGRQLLKDLNITDPGDYGFDTFQFVNMHSNSTLDAVENEVGIVDDYYDRAVDFVLSMDLMGDPRCGSNSDSGNRGTIDRDQDESAYEDVQDNHQDEWINWMDGIAKNKPRDAYLDRGTARQLPWRTSAYQSVKKVYKHFVDFQCKAEARMVDILAGKLTTSRNLIIYPAQRADRDKGVHTASEYTLNTDLVTASNAIREIATWDTKYYTNSKRNDLAQDQGSRKYFFVIQQGSKDLPGIGEDRIEPRISRIQGSVENCLDPDKGQNPWQGSFAFWNDWKKNDSDTENVTAEEQQRYMNNVRATLT